MQTDAVSVSEQRAVARIAGAVAHELNNPLQGVLSLVSVALRESRLDEHSQVRLEQIQHGVSRLSRTVASLSAIYENLPRPPDLVPLTDLITNLSNALAEQGVRVRLHATGSDRLVRCFSPELVRLASGLLREHAQDSATVHLSTSGDIRWVCVQCVLGSESASTGLGEWSSLKELNGVSGMPVLVDELVRLSDGRAEYCWNDSDLTGLRLWMTSA